VSYVRFRDEPDIPAQRPTARIAAISSRAKIARTAPAVRAAAPRGHPTSPALQHSARDRPSTRGSSRPLNPGSPRGPRSPLAPAIPRRPWLANSCQPLPGQRPGASLSATKLPPLRATTSRRRYSAVSSNVPRTVMLPPSRPATARQIQSLPLRAAARCPSSPARCRLRARRRHPHRTQSPVPRTSPSPVYRAVLARPAGRMVPAVPSPPLPILSTPPRGLGLRCRT
jgi:hypothetical protein